MRVNRYAVLCLTIAGALGSGSCSALLAPRRVSSVFREGSTKVRVHDHDLVLHLAVPSMPVPPSTPIVVYASGDGGWFGSAVGMFHTIAATGMPTVGFSSKAFFAIEQRSKPLTAAHVVEGYQRVIDGARAFLAAAPDAPVVLTGWSRGASLAVLVASSRSVDPTVTGIVAIGLAADERLDVEGDTDDDDDADVASTRTARGMPVLDMYPLVARIAPRRAVVIQASHDNYLRAARARELFGGESSVKRFVEIAARNHRFAGGEDAFAMALREAVRWASNSPKD
jgi:hypothetical protein